MRCVNGDSVLLEPPGRFPGDSCAQAGMRTAHSRCSVNGYWARGGRPQREHEGGVSTRTLKRVRSVFYELKQNKF